MARASPVTGILGDLRHDHRAMEALLASLVKATAAAERRDLFARVRHEIEAHARVEDEVFYPAYKLAVAGHDDERALVFTAVEEHAAVATLLAKMATTDPASEAFAAQARLLEDLVARHGHEEELRMFPAAARALGVPALLELQERASTLRQAASADLAPDHAA